MNKNLPQHIAVPQQRILLLTWINFNLRIDDIDYEVCGEISRPFPNVNGTIVDVREWISNSITTLQTMWLLIHTGIKVNPC